MPMDVTELGPKVTDVKLEQLLNTFVAMFVTPSGMAIEVKPDDLNAYVPMLVNWELGPKVTDVKFEQPSNRFVPNTVTESGIVIDNNAIQLLNPLLSIRFTLFGMLIELNAEQLLNA